MIGLIDVDGKLPNLALMKLSSFYKAAVVRKNSLASSWQQ